eukprot:scaffold23705_cov29-Phaeocystis_antarctica.AAC.1
MVAKNRQCATYKKLAKSKPDKKCLSSKWAVRKYCEQSCFDVSLGYSDCCPSPPPSAPPSPPPPS